MTKQERIKQITEILTTVTREQLEIARDHILNCWDSFNPDCCDDAYELRDYDIVKLIHCDKRIWEGNWSTFATTIA